MIWKSLLFAVSLALQIPVQASEDVTGILRQQTQELIDAITTGSATVWDRYLDDNLIYTSEDGTVMSKSQMLEQIKPLPKDVSGNIRVIEFKVAIQGSTAVT